MGMHSGSDRIKQIIEEHGFMPDGDLNEIAEIVVEECIEIIRRTAAEANKKNTYMGDDVPSIVHVCNIKKHFGL